jgi:hypothetical protein
MQPDPEDTLGLVWPMVNEQITIRDGRGQTGRSRLENCHVERAGKKVSENVPSALRVLRQSLPPVIWRLGIDHDALSHIGSAVVMVECKLVPLFIEVRPPGFAIKYSDAGTFLTQAY